MRWQSRLALASSTLALTLGCGGDRTEVTAPLSDEVLLAKGGSSGTSTTTWQVDLANCDFTVTYTWSGFKGRNLIATFGLYERLGQFDASFNLTNVEGQNGRSGTLTHTFDLTPGAHAGRTILARGELVNSRNFQQIEGSTSGTSTLFSTCGP